MRRHGGVEARCQLGFRLEHQRRVAPPLGDGEHRSGHGAELSGGGCDDGSPVVEPREHLSGTLVDGQGSQTAFGMTHHHPRPGQRSHRVNTVGSCDGVDGGERQLVTHVVAVHPGRSQAVVVGGRHHKTLIEQPPCLRCVVVVEEVARGARRTPVGNSRGSVGPSRHRPPIGGS